ncbi:hypothetical protein ACQ4PT_050429 [Festuca glaucescens]
MAAAATAAPKFSCTAAFRNRRDGAHRAGCWPRSRVAANAATMVSSPEAAPAPAPFMRVVVPESLQRASGSLVGARHRQEEGTADGPGAMEYLTAVLTSKVYDVADETALELAKKLSTRLGVNLYFKREDKQPVIIKFLYPPRFKVSVVYCERLDLG